MTTPEIKVEAASVVFVGSFNPAIFQPAWFTVEGLLPKEEAADADLAIAHPEVVAFSVDWFSLEVTRDRWAITSLQPPFYSALRDLALGTFTVLHHTPIRLIGLNRDWHFRMSSEDQWHDFGHRLAPPVNWENMLERPGMRSLTMEGVRPDGFRGYVRVKVEPSAKIHPGVYININDHYEVIVDNSELQAADVAVETVRECWQDSMSRADEIYKKVFSE
jgi:hypothetical protein